jgi:single-strand DNA-binding protein
MNSFTLTAVGNLARNPEAVAKGDVTYTRFCLVGNDNAGKDEKGAPREIATSLWFVAFGPIGERLVRHARKGDQLIIEAQVRANNWTDKQGEKQYDHDFIVQGFRFGAPGRVKRDELSSKADLDGKMEPELKSSSDPKASTEPKAKDTKLAVDSEAELAAATAAPADNKSSAATHEKQSAQRSGRRATAPPH